ncbi:MAG: RidA family protein, partial [Candidatus Wallbacteria bacterium]|nr:RidA family protein [Candidatus Wallbacteria bacterium]
MKPEKALAEMKITLPAAPAAIANYLPAVKCGNVVYVSGQLPLVNGELMYQGRIGDGVSQGQAGEAVVQCTLNALSALRGLAGSLDCVTRVVNLCGF